MDNSPTMGVRGFCILIGIFVTLFGSYKCVMGYIYCVAARHEAATIGQILDEHYGKGGVTYRYSFIVNGVKVDDDCDVCATPLAPRACHNNGIATVYYSYEPYQNSRLQDFAVASKDSLRIGESALGISLLLFLLPSIALLVFPSKDKSDDDSDPGNENSNSEDEDWERKSGDQPDDLHVVPDR